MTTNTILFMLLTALLLSGCDTGSRKAFADSIKAAKQAQRK